jgi:hypothetical protein
MGKKSEEKPAIPCTPRALPVGRELCLVLAYWGGAEWYRIYDEVHGWHNEADSLRRPRGDTEAGAQASFFLRRLRLSPSADSSAR